MQVGLHMGLPLTCAIFFHFSIALAWAEKVKLGVTDVVHFIDDFLFLSPLFQKCKEDVAAFIAAFIALCKGIGLPSLPGKTLGPTTFLESMLDPLSMEAILPHDKLANAS